MELFVLLGMIGPWQIILIILLVVLLFGGKKIPEMLKGLGQGVKEFKKASAEMSEDGTQKETAQKTSTPEEKDAEIKRLQEELDKAKKV